MPAAGRRIGPSRQRFVPESEGGNIAEALRCGPRRTTSWRPNLLAKKERGSLLGCRAASSCERDVVVLERDRANALAGGGKERIEHGGRGDEDRRLAHTTPEPARRHDDRLNLRHLADPHHVVVVEVGLLDAAILDGALAVEQRRQAVDE